jgi:hypothetical protein
MPGYECDSVVMEFGWVRPLDAFRLSRPVARASSAESFLETSDPSSPVPYGLGNHDRDCAMRESAGTSEPIPLSGQPVRLLA